MRNGPLSIVLTCVFFTACSDSPSSIPDSVQFDSVEIEFVYDGKKVPVNTRISKGVSEQFELNTVEKRIAYSTKMLEASRDFMRVPFGSSIPIVEQINMLPEEYELSRIGPDWIDLAEPRLRLTTDCTHICVACADSTCVVMCCD